MKKKITILIIIIILIVLVIVISKIFINKKNQYPKSDFIIDNENKYIITTNMKWITMQNDGGSHTNTYYQINLDENVVIKCQDKYVGFKGYEYEGKVLYKKQLADSAVSELKIILNDVISNEDKEEKHNYNFYTISSFGNENIKVYNKDVIDRIQQLLENLI